LLLIRESLHQLPLGLRGPDGHGFVGFEKRLRHSNPKPFARSMWLQGMGTKKTKSTSGTRNQRTHPTSGTRSGMTRGVVQRKVTSRSPITRPGKALLNKQTETKPECLAEGSQKGPVAIHVAAVSKPRPSCPGTRRGKRRPPPRARLNVLAGQHAPFPPGRPARC
jgi:hypothetical protein